MRGKVALGLLGFALVGCTPAEIQKVNPVVYVPGEYCLDAKGIYEPVVAGTYCCADGYPGACDEGTACVPPDGCTTLLPPNDPGGFERRKVMRRSGL